MSLEYYPLEILEDLKKLQETVLTRKYLEYICLAASMSWVIHTHGNCCASTLCIGRIVF